MPYTVDSANLPANVKALGADAKARWVAAWNSAHESCQKKGGDDCEAQAFKIANGVIRESDGKATEQTAQEALDDLLLLCTEREVPEGYDDIVATLIEHPSPDDTALIRSTYKAIHEAAAMKTENGQKFPAAAFAYVPDPQKPSSWKLRLWETPTLKVTRKQLGAAAAAFSPGGHRGQPVQLPSGEVAKVKGRIRAAYRSLKVEDKNIPKSVQEAEPMKRLLAREASMLDEAGYDADTGEVDVTIIKPGFNVSKKRFYPSATLARDYKVFEGLKMFADHQTPAEERAQPERSIRSWVGSLKHVFVAEDGSIKGRAAIIEPWMKEKLSNLKKAGLLHEMGTSIVASGEGKKAEVEGVKTDFIEKLVHGRSVDFVTYPGAGGTVEYYESARPEDEYDVDVVTVEGLKERRPDIVERITVEIRESLEAEVSSMTEVETELKALKESNETLTAENDGLKTKVAAAEAEDAKREAATAITALIDEAELPDATKARLTEQFKEAESVDGVAEAIAAAITEVAALKEAGVIKGLGNTTPKPPEDGDAAARLLESRKAHYIEQGETPEVAERMATDYVKGR